MTTKVNLADVIDGKPWYQSVTILSALVALTVMIGKMLGYDLSALTGVENEIILVVAAVMTIYGRARAVQPIGGKVQ